MVKLKVRAVGTSAGVILPKDALAHLGVREGDDLYLVETANGYEVTPYDPGVREAARKCPQRYARLQEHAT